MSSPIAAPTLNQTASKTDLTHGELYVISLTFPLFLSHISSAVQLSGLWEEMAAHSRARHPEQILLVSHLWTRRCSFFNFIYFLLLCAAPDVQQANKRHQEQNKT